ncbi:MAG TPA: hypothetical protein VJH22_06795 [Candidatus Nanoarchaeia archaeon]|nr:hypothetical protein [Candidatus Nanoarchaeia archaeon]
MIEARRVGQPRFSRYEIQEISKAWAVLSLAFAIYFNHGISDIVGLVTFFVISGLTVGVGFLLHELGHKFVAQKYGLWAEFRAYNQGLVLALVMSFFGFIFAAPGAVMIHGMTSPARLGKISVAGPSVNYVLAVIFAVLGLLNPLPAISMLFSYGATINAFLGTFNLIPFHPFDGKKILDWSGLRYGMMVVLGFALIVLTMIS